MRHIRRLPREEEISQSFTNEGYDSDDSVDNAADTVLHRAQLQEGAKELYRRRVEIEKFMAMQKKREVIRLLEKSWLWRKKRGTEARKA